MGKIIVTENVSLDGVVGDPTGEEGRAGGGWFAAAADADRAAWAAFASEEAHRAGALLLGRRSEEWFAARWPSRAGAWADRLNAMPKYVVSTTPRAPRWAGATVLTGDVRTTVAELKRTVPGDVVVYASIRLVRALARHGLVDEYRFAVYPVVAGAGQRLFDVPGAALRLVAARAHAGLAVLIYRPTD